MEKSKETVSVITEPVSAAETPSLAASLATLAVDSSSETAEHGANEEQLRALPLITLHDRVYELGAEAAAVLRSLKGQQIAVVSIAGDLRQGKSYILNRLAQAVGGFKTAYTSDPCTHGIWMWPKPVMLEGREHQVIFLDTEGMASFEREDGQSTNIVSLAGLLSSLLIYNQRGTFDENCLNSLGKVAVVMSDLYTHSAAGAGEMCLPPNLLVLLRDHHLDFGEQTPTENLECVLKDRECSGKSSYAVIEKNYFRGCIRSNFPHRCCHPLPTPSAEKDILHNLSSVPDSILNPAFVQGVLDLTEAVYSQATPKLVQGKPMTGPIMLQLLEAAVKAVNTDGLVINLPTVWSAMVANELQAATAAAREVYTSTVDGFKACYTEVMAETVHKAALDSSEACFRGTIKFADPAAIETTLLEHTTQCNMTFSMAVERIKRMQAEDDLSCAKLVQAAREAAQRAFNEVEFTSKALECPGEEAITTLFEEHVERALEVFNTAVEDTLPAADKDEQAKADIEAAIAKARDEVMGYVHKALDLVEQKVNALAKTQEAEALEAERRKLTQHIQQEQELYRLKQDILVDYKAQMQDKQAGFTSVLEAEREHKALLQALMLNLPSNLEADMLVNLKQGLQKECEEVLALTKQLVHDRITHADQATLAAAARDALAVFHSLLDRIPAGCCDEAYVQEMCKGAADTAQVRFEIGASQQATFSVGSPGYVSVHKSLRYDIDRLQKMALTNAQVAKQNSDRLQAALEQDKEAGEAVKRELQAEMERLEAKAAEECARAAEDAERKRVSHEQEMKELHEKQLVVVRKQDDTQLQMWEGRFAAMQAQMQQLTSAISAYHRTGAGRQPYINSVRVTGCYTVEEPDECGPARYRSRAQSCGRQCSGITRKGYRCSRNAQPGRSGCHQH